MPAIVRVKRRIDEEPLNAFVLNGKKRRLDDAPESSQANHALNNDGKDEISTVLKFAGTIQKPDNTATTQFARRINKNDAEGLVQGKTARKAGNHTERARQEMRQATHENRFRVVNCMRTTLGEENDVDASEANTSNKKEDLKSLTIVDIEKQTNETEANMPIQHQEQPQQQFIERMPADSDTGYVYDLYLPDDDVQARNADLMDDNYLSVRAYNEIIFEDTYNDALEDDYDSEDSNREDYFTNDYPDEEDDDEAELHSANGDEDEDMRNMRRAVESFVFDDDDEDENDVYSDASSEDDADYYAYEDPYIQSVDTVNDNFEPDLDAYDVEHHGIAYARYKKRVLKELQRGDDDDDDSVDDGKADDDKSHGSDKNTKSTLNISSDLELYHSANEHE